MVVLAIAGTGENEDVKLKKKCRPNLFGILFQNEPN